jgi:hypothetical protein
MSQQPTRPEQGADMPDKEDDKRPKDAPTPEQQTQHDYTAHVLAFSRATTRDELEDQFDKTHAAMLDVWEE